MLGPQNPAHLRKCKVATGDRSSTNVHAHKYCQPEVRVLVRDGPKELCLAGSLGSDHAAQFSGRPPVKVRLELGRNRLEFCSSAKAC